MGKKHKACSGYASVADRSEQGKNRFAKPIFERSMS